MRAAGYLSIRLSISGHYREAAELQRDSLRLFWSRPYPAVRGQQFYRDLTWISQGLSLWHTGMAASEMASALAEAAGADGADAVVRAHWAGIAQRAGEFHVAVEQ